MTVNLPVHPGKTSTKNESDTYQTDLWLGTLASLNLSNGDTDFSACATAFDLPLKTVKHEQNDDGYCRQILDDGCVKALQSKAESIACYLTASDTLGTYSNLMPPILDSICTEISNELGYFRNDGEEGESFPTECQPYMY